jgi:cysteinyl-tRNA synthetase
MNTVQIYDTLSRSMQPITAADGTTFRFYCCGPTVYGPAHVGNFRTFIVQDLLRRVIEASGLPTRHVRNITDVDDKTIAQSQAAGQSLGDFTSHWLARFRADGEALNLLPPHVEPSAVEHIPEQIDLIQQLIDKNHAYVAEDGSVYYRVESFPCYGCLSRLAERKITTGATPDAQASDEYDRDSAADFALWKAQKPEDGPNAWPSPWGPGRPGWHTECSAMSMKYLGASFDLHGGGVDLVFPHHENEIAQSEAATGQPFSRLWFHSAHLMVEGRKMSKSLGNLYTLADIEARGFTAMALRYVLLSGHYRQPLNFTWDSLKAATSALRRLQQAERDLAETAGAAQPDAAADDLFEPVYNALADNLNTPDALGRLFTALHAIERERNAGMTPARAAAVHAAYARVLDVWGFRFEATEQTAPAEIQALAEQRWNAKQARDFATADALRAQLTEQGWAVKDSKDGYTLQPNNP